ncbi:MAG TPA: hypothetical protein VGU90_13335 [Terriglobales bacterium]|nr:hypothetical protein [Terriglobales bacterium]
MSDEIIIPDRPQTALAFRTWRVSEHSRLLSINAPDLTGSAGGKKLERKISWIHRQLADSEGQDGWPIGKPLVAHCGRGGKITPWLPGGPVAPVVPALLGDADPVQPVHGPIPEKKCSCGIYATTSIDVINQYLGNEVIFNTCAIRGPVMGIVELGGRVIPATQGYRAAYARIAAIIAVDAAFSLSKAQLKMIAEIYQVPLVGDLSLDPEEYRDKLVPSTRLADEAEQYLKELLEGGEE